MPRRIIVIVLVAAFVAAGCGTDSGAPPVGTSPGTTSTTAAASSTVTTSAPVTTATTAVPPPPVTTVPPDTTTTVPPATTTTVFELADIDPPDLTVDEWPTDPSYDEFAELSGTVEVGSTVLVRTEALGRLSIFGAKVTGGSWTAIVPVAVGLQEIAVVARDYGGNESQISVVVERLESVADTSLADFIAAAEELDERIRAASDLFNSTVIVEPWGCALADPPVADCSVTVPSATQDAIWALAARYPDHRSSFVPVGSDGRRLADLIPAGLDLDTRTAALAVYADLDSRVTAMITGSFEAWLWDCFEHGAVSARRFPDDLARLKDLAAHTAAPDASMDSPAGLDLATEIYLIHLFNRGCGACGGAVYTGPIDHSHVEVEATWDGARWQIYIAAC